MDRISQSARSANMSRIRASGTQIEVAFSKALRDCGFTSASDTSWPGRPDFVFSKAGVIVFLDSCFWHKCPYHYRQPQSHLDYWVPKIEGNAERDKRIRRAYRRSGWKVLRFWQHQIERDIVKCCATTIAALRSRNGRSSAPPVPGSGNKFRISKKKNTGSKKGKDS